MGILVPVLGRAREKGRTTVCSSHMRQLSMASHMYTQDFDGFFAKTSHSAAVHRCLRWGQAFSPYLGAGRFQGPTTPAWQNLFYKFYHCPTDKRKDTHWSYGKNVWFELTSIETAYVKGESSGGPVYNTIMQVRHPAATVEFGEMIDTSTMMGSSAADHVMAHFWLVEVTTDPGPEIDKKRHGRMANYSYVDGHVLSQDFKETFDNSNPKKRLDNWNPGTAH